MKTWRVVACGAGLAALAGCARTSAERDAVPVPDAASATADEVTGVLRVTAGEAYVEGRPRIILIQASPQTAASHVTLMARTADALRPLDGKRVRARGDLQDRILWGARVEPADAGERGTP